MKNYVWESQSNTADIWSFTVKVLAKLLVSQERGFVFLSNQSSQVTLAIAKAAAVPNIRFETGFLC